MTTTSRYQRIIQFSIKPHSIYIQARRDLNKQWLPIAYKITDEELEAIVQYWLDDWHEPMSTKEIYAGQPADALDELVQLGKDLHNFDGESSIDFDPQSKRMLEELHTKICMDFDTDNNSHLVMENHLQRFLKALTDASNAAAQAMHISSQEGFTAVSVN